MLQNGHYFTKPHQLYSYLQYLIIINTINNVIICALLTLAIISTHMKHMLKERFICTHHVKSKAIVNIDITNDN